MKDAILTTILGLLLAGQLFAQTENSAPVLWERYKVSDKRVSVMLPKMPTVQETADPCREEQTASYYAYAEGVVYEITIIGKMKARRPEWCSVPRTEFDQARFSRRLDEIRERQDKPTESVTSVGGLQAHRFTGERFSRLLVSDVEDNKRWIEMSMTYYADSKPDFDRFLGSLDFSTISGKEIGGGSKVTLGDLVSTNDSAAVPAPPAPAVPVTGGTGAGVGPGSADKSSSDTPRKPSYTIIAKPRASYTEAARRANTQGHVRLKVTLLANGAVGTVTPITTLDHGLTEQSIAAARRIVFLPKRVNGVPVTVVITIEYGFTIY